MQSHTVPRKLLEQFAYDDPITGSKRLWRYEKDRSPHPKASPRTATRIDGHFFDPEDAANELAIEISLNRDFETPVNGFLSEISSPDFVFTEERRKQLTFYITLLFNRSEARRKASSHLLKVSERAFQLFIENETQTLTVAAKWSIDALLSGRVKHGFIRKEQIIESARDEFNRISKSIRAQRNYIATIESAMAHIDEQLFTGIWHTIKTRLENPFFISDAPVVTWERLPDGQLSYGTGFHRSDVEVVLPISPCVCLHMLPNVERTRPSTTPSVFEVNAAQAAFATRFCFSNNNNSALNQIFDENYGRAELGTKSFTVWHRDYSTSVFDILMNNGRWIEPGK